MSMFAVKLNAGLSPPDLHESKEEAHQFYLSLLPVLEPEDRSGYTLQEVRPMELGDLIPNGALTSIMRERSAELLGDNSLFDSDKYLERARFMEDMARSTINTWAEINNIYPDSRTLVSSEYVKA